MKAFSALALETVRDAIRRRGLIAAALASGGVALLLQRCGGCEATVTLQGERLASGGDLGAWAALASFAGLTLWSYAVTSLLASDSLATAIEDGSVESVLARPVARETVALARLAGTWLGAGVVGGALWALAVGLAATRLELAPGPAWTAGLAVGLGAWSVAAGAMALSLALPRAATLLLWATSGAVVCGAEGALLLGAEPEGVLGVLATWGPAWITAPVASLGPWVGGALPVSPVPALLRAGVWAVGATALLAWGFRRLELPR